MKQISLVKEIQDDAMRFGNIANLARAIPYIKDGLKPSQRYTIYIAQEKGYFSNKPHVKSLKLDGQIVGEAWPHGSEYSTIVRLCQPFVQNIPLIDMHGSFGSQLGTPDAAASRYTEVRLSKACEDGLLKNLDKNVCDWIPNYSEDKMLPALLPALLPVLYCNGSEGLGFCYSQTWLPGNLIEFTEKVKEYIKKGKVSCDNIYPDFPTKGTIINKSDIHTIYETGQGVVILRGKAEIRGNTIIITELPYQIYVSDYLDQLKSLISPDKNGVIKINGIENIYNMSGTDGMHIEIECNGDKIDAGIVLNKLYQYSNLQIKLSANQYGIIDGLPELINLEKYIKVYVDHNINCIQREYKFDLDKAEARLEIVEGLIRAIKIIGNVIAVIRSAKSSEAAKQELVEKLNFTENQAKAIVNMTLGKLANMESTDLLNEQTALQETIKNCKEMLADITLQQKEFLKRLTAFTKTYGWERRTQVEDVDIVEEKKEAKAKIEKVEEIYNIILTKDNKIKKVVAGKIKKTADMLSIIQVGAKDKFILISETGKMYKLLAKQITLVNAGSGGQSLNDLVNDKIVNIFTGYENQEFIIMITALGKLKKIKSSDVFELSKKIGCPIMKVDKDDSIIDCRLADDSDKIYYTIGNKEKELLVKDFLDKGRSAGGVTAIKLSKKLNTFKIKKED